MMITNKVLLMATFAFFADLCSPEGDFFGGADDAGNNRDAFVQSDTNVQNDTNTTGTCNDGEKNQNETDVDCGGVCGATCERGQNCLSVDDCVSSTCVENGGGAGTRICAESFPLCTSQSDIALEECQALEALYNATDGVNWSNPSTPWFGSGSICSWDGVVYQNKHVVALNLFGKGLKGTLPPTLKNLAWLTTCNSTTTS